RHLLRAALRISGELDERDRRPDRIDAEGMAYGRSPRLPDSGHGRQRPERTGPDGCGHAHVGGQESVSRLRNVVEGMRAHGRSRVARIALMAGLFVGTMGAGAAYATFSATTTNTVSL